LFHLSAAADQQKYHLMIEFEDGTTLSAFTQMWGAMELYQIGDEQKWQFIQGMHTAPLEAAFTEDYSAP